VRLPVGVRSYDWLLADVGSLAPLSEAGEHAGGEWDWYRTRISRRDRRRLVGAGFVRAGGWAPDQLAHQICDHVGRDWSTDRAIEWYVRTALHLLDTHQRERTIRSRAKRAANAGAVTFFDYRDKQAVDAGYKSFYAMRIEKWSSSGHESGRARMRALRARLREAPMR
jgi:hypothetical protein